ncbi:MAG: TIGR01777 family oxidoreductase, partial [Nitrospira sp.]|nr:TIGR01777 family oxidoreductase [Nitrospira sp.]
GRALCASLCQAGHHVTLLTRRRGETPQPSDSTITAVEWDGRTAGEWAQCLEGADVVINLAGASIADGRWTDARKQLLTDSRILPTRLLVEAISRCSSKPHTLINASGIGYYGSGDDQERDENAPQGSGFLADLCLAWEREALKANEFGVRVVPLRIGMVLGPNGGALAKMLPPFQFFLGGPIMPGTQWVSWIHRDDLIGLIQWLLVTKQVSGPINAVAPESVTMAQFCTVLGQILHRPSWLPVPNFILNIMLGELATLMTTGQRVLPKKALSDGYGFLYPQLDSALANILAKHKRLE